MQLNHACMALDDTSQSTLKSAEMHTGNYWQPDRGRTEIMLKSKLCLYILAESGKQIVRVVLGLKSALPEMLNHH